MTRTLDVQASYARRALYEAARLRLARLQVGGGQSFRAAAQESTRLAARTLLVDRASIWLALDEEGTFRCFDVYERAADAHSEGALLHRHEFPEYFAAIERRRVLVADDARIHPDTRCLASSYLLPLDIHSMLDAPIYRAGKVVGVVCHEVTGSRRAWTPEDADFATTVADSIALQLEGAARHEVEEQLATQEEYVAEVQTMEAIGRMAAGVAHDFRNILTVVLGHARLIERDEALPLALRDEVDRLISAAEHGVGLTKELAILDREGDPLPPEAVRVRDVVSDFLEVLRAAVGKRHRIEFDPGELAGWVLVNPARLERVLLNLVLNSRDALTNGGQITLRVREQPVTDGPGPPGVYVVLEVRDEGEGMDALTMRRAFEPFFSRKPGNRGTGLGLAVVQRTVENAGGFVLVESAPQRGTTMRVYLPRFASRG